MVARTSRVEHMDTTEPVQARKVKKDQVHKKVEVICASENVDCELEECESEELNESIKTIRSQIKKRK